MNRWEAWNERRKLGEGWGTGLAGVLGSTVKEAVFRGLPSLPFSFLSGSPDPQGAQALSLPECPFRRKGV